MAVVKNKVPKEVMEEVLAVEGAPLASAHVF